MSRRLSLFALAALLAGCATAPPSNTTVASYRDSIELNGRLQVKYHKDGQPGFLTGNFDWSQAPGRVDVTMYSPTGQTVAVIKVTPDQATLTEANRPPRTASDIDSLSAQALGWSLPVSGLRDWLQGYATAADGKRFIASPSNNSVFTRDGWRLRFVSWQDPKAATPQPRVIRAERSASATSEELEIDIVILSAT